MRTSGISSFPGRRDRSALLAVGAAQGRGRSAQPASRACPPTSKKGRGVKLRSSIAVPVSLDTLDRLEPTMTGRDAHEPLLLRWTYRQVAAPSRLGTG